MIEVERLKEQDIAEERERQRLEIEEEAERERLRLEEEERAETQKLMIMAENAEISKTQEQEKPKKKTFFGISLDKLMSSNNKNEAEQDAVTQESYEVNNDIFSSHSSHELEYSEDSGESFEYAQNKDVSNEVEKEIIIPGLVLEEEEISALINPDSNIPLETQNSEDSNSISSEKEKMLAGELYIAWGDDFIIDKRRARNLLKEFNTIDVEDKKATVTILKELFKEIGEYIHIEPSFKCDYGYNISVGDNFYAGEGCAIFDSAKVTIGDNCIMSPRVSIHTLSYPLEVGSRSSGYEYAKPVKIGDNVWIGGNAVINPGVTIGNNAVIAPGSVVATDIPDNVYVEGNPAKIVKNLNTEKEELDK